MATNIAVLTRPCSMTNARKPAPIQLPERGIVSPLRPGELIDYDRVVVDACVSGDNSATVLDRLPADLLPRGNFDIGVEVRIETDWLLLL